jgi:magnesium transporter
MRVSCFELKKTGVLQPVDAEEASGRWRAGDGAFWVDIESYQAADLKKWLDALDLPPFVTERCLDIGNSTQMIPLPEYAFLEITVFSDDELSSLTNVGMICLKNFLITLHPEPIHNIKKILRSIDELKLKDISTSGLLSVLLLIQANEAATAARAVQASLSAIDERMDKDPGSVSLDEILAAKDAVSRVIAVSEEQEECFKVLAGAETEALDFSNLRGSMKLLISTAGSINRHADRLEKRVVDIRLRYNMYQQDKTNHRLAVLTVISAVFLPLTLMAGIWGMNFTLMPLVQLSFGYHLALGLMVLIAGVLTWLFYTRGWFD